MVEPLDDGQPTSVVVSNSTVERGSQRPWLVAVIALVSLIGFGAWSTWVDVEGRDEAAAVPDAVADEADVDVVFIVWMDPASTDDEASAIRLWLDEAERVTNYDFIDRHETISRFVQSWHDSPRVIESVAADELPTSFRVEATDHSLAFEASSFDGVLKVDDASVLGDGSSLEAQPPLPLLLIPNGGFDWDSDVDLFEVPDENNTSSTIVGTPTSNGYESIVSVSLTAWSPAEGGASDSTMIDGRSMLRSRNAWSEKVGTEWIVYRTTADAESIADVVGATSVVTGEAVVEESLLDNREILATVGGIETSDLVGFSSYTSPLDDLVAGREAPFTYQQVIAVPWVNGPDDVVAWGVFGSSMERTTVSGRPGYFIRESADGGSLPGRSVVWATDSGHMVIATLSGATDDELITYAESLSIVNRARWDAEANR